VVETNKNESDRSLIGSLGEKVEDKLEEKVQERPMREGVTIPKIVQPIS
jgi:hypothetical protein